MAERIPQANYDPKQPVTRREAYPDGSVNLVADRVGDVIDLNVAGHDRLNLNPAAILDITTEEFDEKSQKLIRTDYVITEGGFGPGVVFTSVKGEQGARTRLMPEYNEEWINSLTSAPLTIGSRPSRLQGAKLKSVSAALSYDIGSNTPDKATANPIMVAIRLIDERNNQQ